MYATEHLYKIRTAPTNVLERSSHRPGAARAACQRCHAATGATNFLTAPATYNPANNDFSHLSNWNATEGSSQNGMLYCWGCHSSVETGALRNPGALTIPYTNAPTAYPDARGANVCLACHTGRESGDSIKNSTATFTDVGFINSHYLTAGGTVFAQSGYTYGDRDYSIPAGDRHDKLGMGVATGNVNYDAVRNNYTQGPCVTCNFESNDGSHTLSPFTLYSEGDLALNPVCVNCHTARGEGSNAAHAWLGTDFTVDDLAAGVNAPHKGRYLAAWRRCGFCWQQKGITLRRTGPTLATATGPSTATVTARTPWARPSTTTC